MTALDVDHVDAAYGPYRALFGVSFAVPDGGAVALLGPNGAGKSTVARVVSGLLPAAGGRVVVGGTDVTGWPAHRVARAGVAHVPEGRGIFAELTVEENLVVAFRQRAGRRAVAGALARAYDAFPVLGERRRQRGGTLSGGQQRLLSLAKVLVVPPKLLIADELSLGLSPAVVDAVYEQLRLINQQGTALLVVEQQVDRVLALAPGAVVLEHGTVTFDGPAAEALAAAELLLAGEIPPPS
jgi:branched-chain amino acid transport system ATP-binding protein